MARSQGLLTQMARESGGRNRLLLPARPESMSTPRRRACPAAVVAGTVLAGGLLLGPAVTSAGALSCVEPERVASEHPHLFTARVVASAGDRYLLAPIAQRPGAPVPTKVWVQVEMPEWLFWNEEGNRSPVGTDRILLVSADADWVSSACALWETSELDSEWIAPVAAQITEPVQPSATSDGEAHDGEGHPGNPPTPNHSPAALAGAAGAGSALGAVALVIGLRRRR